MKAVTLGNFAIRSLILASLAVCSQKSIVQATTFTFMAGVNDNFSTSNGAELSSPGMNLTQFATNSNASVTTSFDDSRSNKWFLHTFVNLPSNITSATLEFRAKPNDSCNDGLLLAFIGTNGSVNSPYYNQYLGLGGLNDCTGSTPGLASGTWRTTSYPAGNVFTLDLAALPPSLLGISATNLLAGLNSNQSLDFLIQDDTNVDYIKLTVITTPESSPVFGLLSLGTLGAVLLLKKVFRHNLNRRC